jgi:hypothetical protein
VRPYSNPICVAAASGAAFADTTAVEPATSAAPVTPTTAPAAVVISTSLEDAVPSPFAASRRRW